MREQINALVLGSPNRPELKLPENDILLAHSIAIAAYPSYAEGLKNLLCTTYHIIFIYKNSIKKGFLDFMHTLKSNVEFRNIPVVVLDVFDIEEEIIAFNAGAAGYKSPPFELRRFLSIIDHFIFTEPKHLAIKDNDNAPVYTSATRRLPFPQNFTNYILQNINRDVRIEEVCSVLNISRPTLQKKSKDVLHKRPMEHILDLRIRYAKKLLLSNRYSVKIVSDMAGFTSSAYFCRTFKKKMGMKPSEFLLLNHITLKK